MNDITYNFEVATADIHVGSIEVEETPPAGRAATLLGGARVGSEVLVANVVVEEVRARRDEVRTIGVGDVVGNLGL